jgi:hypothetical protein
MRGEGRGEEEKGRIERLRGEWHVKEKDSNGIEEERGELRRRTEKELGGGWGGGEV